MSLRMWGRAIWQVILAALMSLGVYCLFSILIAALLQEVDSARLRNILLGIVCTLVYAVCFVCFIKVRGGQGADELFDDYDEREYSSMWGDLPYVLQREWRYAAVMWAIMLFCYFANLIWMGGMGQERVFPLSFAMIPMTAGQLFFNSGVYHPLWELVGYLVSAAMTPAVCLVGILLHRRLLWGSRYSIRTAHLRKRSRHYYGQFRKR